MDKLQMCRVCLKEDNRLHSIVETHLKEMYESLVLMPLETKDRRPKRICYICRARLQNCYALRRCCLRSEELLTQMLIGDESEPVELQEIDDEKRLSVVYNVIHFSMGQVLQMSVDNVGVKALMCDDVKVEQNDAEDIDEDALEEYSVYAIIQSADADNDPLIIVKGEQSGDRKSDPTPKESEQSVQRNPQDLTSSNLDDHDLVQDMFRELNKVTGTDKTAAKSTNVVPFSFNDNNKERSTSVPHSERVQYTCDTCQQCYSSKCKLEKHIRLCSDVWKKDFSRENSTSSHTHTGQRPHQCCACKKSFISKSHLGDHIRTHTGEKPHHCDICKKQFSTSSTLTKHMRTHTGKKPYLCDICKKQFTQKSSLTTHMRTHTGEKSYHCDVCDKQFSLKNGLAMHIRTHTGEKPYHCNVCEKQFSQKNGLAVHMRTHTGKKPFQCNICKKYFTQGGHLNRHMRTHTGEKPYHCYTCKKNFSQDSSLTKHMRTHTGEKPYHCYTCKKKFSQDSSLTQHVRIHTGEKPYHCNTCKKQFSLNSSLTQHMRIHTGEKPYHCDICEKCFSVRIKLTRHIRTHT